jgi:hypothetical protein
MRTLAHEKLHGGTNKHMISFKNHAAPKKLLSLIIAPACCFSRCWPPAITQPPVGSAEITAPWERRNSGDVGKRPSSSGYARLEPGSGCYVGVSMDTNPETVAEFSKACGFSPAVYVTFVQFPLSEDDKYNLKSFAETIAPTGAIALITLEPSAAWSL